MVEIQCFKDCDAEIMTDTENVFKIVFAQATEDRYELKLRDMRTGRYLKQIDWFKMKADGSPNVRTKTKYDRLCHILGIKVESETFFPDPDQILGACVKGYTKKRDAFIGNDGFTHVGYAVLNFSYPGDENVQKYGRKDQKLAEMLVNNGATVMKKLGQDI